MVENGCSYGKVTRTMVDNIQKSLDRIESKNTEMFNHFSERYEVMFEKLRSRAPYSLTIVISILATFLGIAGTLLFTR